MEIVAVSSRKEEAIKAHLHHSNKTLGSAIVLYFVAFLLDPLDRLCLQVLVVSPGKEEAIKAHLQKCERTLHFPLALYCVASLFVSLDRLCPDVLVVSPRKEESIEGHLQRAVHTEFQLLVIETLSPMKRFLKMTSLYPCVAESFEIGDRTAKGID